MAKRRADDTLLHHAPSKRCYHSVCGIDMQFESMVAPKNPPSLCRKRPYYSEDLEQQQQQKEEAPFYRKTINYCDTRRHAADVFTVPTSGSFQDRRNLIKSPNSKKRLREDSVGPETVFKAKDEVSFRE